MPRDLGDDVPVEIAARATLDGDGSGWMSGTGRIVPLDDAIDQPPLR